jgi:lipopolysaccharide export system protein LptA
MKHSPETLMRYLRLSLAFLFLCLSLPAQAQDNRSTDDRDQPITIEADKAEINDREQISIYVGNVVLTQGGLKIRADLMTIYLKDKELQKVVAEGNPARYEQARANEETIYGKSQRLDYAADTGQLFFVRNAEIWQGENRFSGERILYDLNTEKVVASGAQDTASTSGQRVQVTIQPKAKNEQADRP